MDYYRNWDEVVSNVRKIPQPQRVVVAAAQDEHTLEAIRQVAAEGLVTPVLVGDQPAIRAIAERLGLQVDPDNIYHELDPEQAARLAVRLVRQGKGDFLMKGILETSQLLKAVVNKEEGLSKGHLMSHVAYLEVPRYHKMLVLTDTGMIPYPNLEQKKGILDHAVNMLLSLGYECPLVGVLAGVEKVNPKMPETIDAATLKEMNQKGEIKNCIVEGPISLDLALVKEKATIKNYHSQVAGEADILLTPNLCTGNCVSKAMIEMGGAQMAGLIMGAKVPIVITSRASSTQEKKLSLILAAACANPQKPCS